MDKTPLLNLNNSSLENMITNIQDKDIFYKLYLYLKGPIYAYSLTILKNREDALDNVQDVFITIYNQASSYESNKKALNWIFTITKNKAISKLRKRKETFDIDDYNISKDNFSNKEDLILFKFLMETLKDDEKLIILMHLLWGFKHHEIAKILNIKVSTVLSKYHRAIKKLKEMEVE